MNERGNFNMTGSTVNKQSINQSNKEIVQTIEIYDDGFLRVEHQYFYVTCNGKSLSLGRAEFLILSKLVRNIDRFISNQAIWSHIWDESKPLNQESLKVMICKLRRQLSPFGIIIQSRTKIGYKLISTEKNQLNKFDQVCSAIISLLIFKGILNEHCFIYNIFC